MTFEFPTGTRYLQLRGAAVAVTPDECVYRIANGRAVLLVPEMDALAATDEMPPANPLLTTLSGDEE